MKKTFSISEALSFGWHTFKSNWKFWIVAFLILMTGVGYGGSNLSSLSGLGGMGASSESKSLQKFNNNTIEDYGIDAENQYRNFQREAPSENLLNLKSIESSVLGMATSPVITSEKSVPGFMYAIIPFVIVFAVIFFIIMIVMSLMSLIFQMGYINLTLDAARGKQVYYKTLLNQVSFKKAFKLLIAQLCVGFLVMCGLILFIVPGIIFALKYVFVPYVMVDQDVPSIKSALKGSSQITKGVRGKLFGFSIVSILVWFAGLIAFGVGTVVSTIVLALATAYIYKELADGDSSPAIEVPIPSPEPVVVGEASGSLESLTAPSGL